MYSGHSKPRRCCFCRTQISNPGKKLIVPCFPNNSRQVGCNVLRNLYRFPGTLHLLEENLPVPLERRQWMRKSATGREEV